MPYNSKRKFFYYKEKTKLLAVVLLSLASLALLAADHRYAIEKQNLLPNLDFVQFGKYWTGTTGGIYVIPESPATLVVRNDGRRQTLATQTLRKPDRYEGIQVSVDVRFDAIVAGSAWWQKAGVVLLSYDRQGKRMTYWPYEIAFRSGTQDWRRYVATIPTDESMKSMQVFILHGGKSGELRIRNLQVDAVREATWFTVAEKAILLLWAGTAAWVLVPLLILHRREPLAYLTLATFLGMLSVSVLPQPLLSTSSQPALDQLAEWMAPETEPADAAETDSEEKKSVPRPAETKAQKAKKADSKPTIVAKRAPISVRGDVWQYSAHFFSHVLLAILVGLAFRAARWWRLTAYLFLAAATNELLQIFVITRAADLLDGAANVAGAAAGLALCYGLLMAWRRFAP